MNRNRIGISRKYLVLLVLALVSAMAVPIFARYVKQTEELVNTFSHTDRSQPEISEDFDGTVKENVLVKVGDTGYPVYVRATIVITWKTKDGIVHYKKPVPDTDYEIVLNETDWELDEDGYYYYKYAVPSNGETSYLIVSCRQPDGFEPPEEGYFLSVEIIAQTVQAVGSTDVSGDPTKPGTPAYKDAWDTSWEPSEPAAPDVDP